MKTDLLSHPTDGGSSRGRAVIFWLNTDCVLVVDRGNKCLGMLCEAEERRNAAWAELGSFEEVPDIYTVSFESCPE